MRTLALNLRYCPTKIAILLIETNENAKSANLIAATLDNPKKVLSELTSKISTAEMEQLTIRFIFDAVDPELKAIGYKQVSVSGTVFYS